MAAVGVYVSTTHHIDVSGSGAQIGIQIGAAVLGIQDAWIIGWTTFSIKADVVKGIDVIVAHIESGILIEVWRIYLHAWIVYAVDQQGQTESGHVRCGRIESHGAIHTTQGVGIYPGPLIYIKRSVKIHLGIVQGTQGWPGQL